MFGRKRFYRIVIYALTALLLAGLLSCSRRREAERRGGTLIAGEIADFESLNPFGTTDAHARDVYFQLFPLLLDENPDFLTFGPRLATSYEFNEDRTVLTFHLRKDVVWSDGMPFTAHDVEATFARQIDPDVAWPSRHLKEHIEKVEAVDEHTVAYHFSKVYPYQVMDANDGSILPKHFLESVEPADLPGVPVERIPVIGPFRIHEWIRGQTLTLVPNEHYYDEGKPLLDKVIFKVIPDQVTLITQLKSGEIDLMESIPPREVKDLEANADLHVFKFPTRGYGYIGWNAAHPFFSEMDVRRALTMAIDRKLIIDNLFYGTAEECTSPFVPLLWAYNPDIEPVPFDPDRASEILSANGFIDSDGDGWLDRNSRRFEFELLTNQGNQSWKDIQLMVQDMLGRVGIKVNTTALEWTAFLDRAKSSDFDAIVSAWRVGTKADLSPIWACRSRREGGYNRTDYCNATVDSLNDAACGMLEFEEARPLFNRAQEIIYKEQPYTFVYRRLALNALSKRFNGAKPDAISMYHNLHEWWVSAEE